MKFSISLLSFCILSFIIVFSCSTEEVQDTTPPPSIIQNPEPETPNPTQYTLNVNAGEGGSVSSEGGTYDEGTDINLTATPNGEYVFLNWSNGSTDNPISFELNSDTNLTANFEKRKYALTINILGEGIVTEEIIETGKSTDYESGTKVKLTAVPSEGWVFRSWGELVEIQELSYELIIDEPKEVNVIFEEFVEEGFAKVSFKGNGIYKRQGSPYPPINYSIVLIDGEKNNFGHYKIGSKIKLSIEENRGWGINKSELEDITIDLINGQTVSIEDNIEVTLNVEHNWNSFPFEEINSDGTFLNVGVNIASYDEWNLQNSELKYYVTNDFLYPPYVEAYKDRIYEIRQLLGEWGPLDILLFDMASDKQQNNRDLYRKRKEEEAYSLYKNQIIGNIENWVSNEMKTYDENLLNNNKPFNGSGSTMGGRKFIGLISNFNNDNTLAFGELETVAGARGIGVEELINSGYKIENNFPFNAYHEYIHVWQQSQNKHGFIQDISGNHGNTNWSVENPDLDRIWVSPRWFIEGQCMVIQAILNEKMNLPLQNSYCCLSFEENFKVRDFINHIFNSPDRSNLNLLQRIEPNDGENRILYQELGHIASFYKFAKMNHDLSLYMQFVATQGSKGYEVAMREFLGISEDDFYNEFNNWFFDSSISDSDKLNYLYPEGTDPIQVDIQSRR